MEDMAELERIYSEHASPLRRLLRVLIRDPAIAEDLTQETFLQFWRQHARFDPGRASLRAYLFGVARKKASEWRRRHAVASRVTEKSQTVQANERVLTTDMLNRLSPDAREILWLREVEGYSYQELADMLHIPVGTVRSRLHGAREQLRSIWGKKKEHI